MPSPGLVNAHCHLEYTDRPGPTAGPIGFAGWVRELGDGAKDPAKILSNLAELVRTGTAAVVNHVTPDHDLGYLQKAPIGLINYAEVVGASRERAATSLARARESGYEPTPHSYYALHPEILETIVPRSVHFLESAEEREWWDYGTGPLADLVRERGGKPFPGKSLMPLILAHPPALFIHANYVGDKEIEMIRKSGGAVVHCPGSHRFFRHRPFPLRAIQRAGIPIALGTDSLASNDRLDMAREIALLKQSSPDLSDEEILKFASFDLSRLAAPAVRC